MKFNLTEQIKKHREYLNLTLERYANRYGRKPQAGWTWEQGSIPNSHELISDVVDFYVKSKKEE